MKLFEKRIDDVLFNVDTQLCYGKKSAKEYQFQMSNSESISIQLDYNIQRQYINNNTLLGFECGIIFNSKEPSDVFVRIAQIIITGENNSPLFEGIFKVQDEEWYKVYRRRYSRVNSNQWQSCTDEDCSNVAEFNEETIKKFRQIRLVIFASQIPVNENQINFTKGNDSPTIVSTLLDKLYNDNKQIAIWLLGKLKFLLINSYFHFDLMCSKPCLRMI